MRRYPIAVVGILVWPTVMPVVYVLQGYAFAGGDSRALGHFASLSGTTDIATFVFVGMAMYVWLSTTLWGPGTALRKEQVRGSLEAQFTTPAARSAILFGPALPWSVIAVVDLAIMLLVLAIGFGVELSLSALLSAAFVLILTMPAMLGLGALFSTLVLRAGDVNSVVQLTRGVLTVLCGVTYPIVLLPIGLRLVVSALPPTIFISDARAILLDQATLVSLGPDLVLLAVSGVALCVGGTWAFRSAERNARRRGSLGLF